MLNHMTLACELCERKGSRMDYAVSCEHASCLGYRTRLCRHPRAGRIRRRKGQNNRAQYPKQVTLFAANQLCYSLIAYIEQKNGL